MTDSKYRVRKEYSDSHQMYFYYPEEKFQFLWMTFWGRIGGAGTAVFSDEKRAIEYIKKYDSGEYNPTQYIYLDQIK